MESAETQTQKSASMKSDLILDSLEIQGFRGFRHLRIEKLGRVNLIVGKNSVGKTALLEALWLYASRGSTSVVWEILESRDEGVRPTSGREFEENMKDRPLAIKQLFYGRKDVREFLSSILIGPIGYTSNSLSIKPRWYETLYAPTFGPHLESINPEQLRTANNPVLAIATQMSGQPEIESRLIRESYLPLETDSTRYIFIPAGGLPPTEVEALWSSISLTNLETNVIDALKIIDKRIERVNLLSDPNRGKPLERIPKVKIEGIAEPLFFRSFGDGMNRLFGIALALVNAKDGMLLIDEVENGLHYSVQPDVWKLIFETARNLNVQVFATTHSWDCIKAFQKAAAESPEDGLLVRLAERESNIIADVFSEKELGIATKRQIELR